jgi:DNA primase
VYRDASGAPHFRKVRNLPGREPRFWLKQPDGNGGWKTGTKDVDTKIIYRAGEVAKAIADGRVIAVVEGEKDVDNLWGVGIPATCNAHGASEPGKRPKWMKAHSEQLAGAHIIVFNDNDAAGYEHADATCRLSFGVAKRVRRLDLAKHWPDFEGRRRL